MKEAIVLFTKVPVVGAVKTRLTKECGAFSECDAYELYKHLLQDTAAVIHNLIISRGVSTYICYTPKDGGADLAEVLGPIAAKSIFIEQQGSDVTERVRNAFRFVLGQGCDYAILIPGDHDDLDTSTLCCALDCLAKATVSSRPQIVIGPTHDGGAYLLGLNKYTDIMCLNNLQDTHRICCRIIQYARTRLIPYKILDVRMDIDDLSDVFRVITRKRRLNTATENFLLNHPRPHLVDKHDISVIIPTFNEEAWIKRALTSIDRKNVNTEVIVVDGGSADNTLEIAADLADKVVVSRRASRKMQENLGAYAARGGILLFLHADMILQDKATVEVVRAFKDRSVVAGSLDVFYYPTKIRYAFLRCIRLTMRRLLNVHGVGAAFCVRRSAFYRLGGFDQSFMEEGVALSQRLRKIGRLTTVNAAVIVSARRFEKKGYFKTLILWALTVLFTTLRFKGTWLEDKLWKNVN